MAKVAVAVAAVVAVVAAVAFLQPELLPAAGGELAAVTGGDAIGGALAGASFGAALTGASGIGAAFSAWTSVIAVAGAVGSLALGMPQPGTPGTQVQNGRNPQAPNQALFGRSATGGNIVYQNTWGTNNRYLTKITTLSVGPVTDIESCYYDDFLLNFGSDPTNSLQATTSISPNGGNTKMFVNRVRQEWRLGTTTEATLATSQLDDPQLTSTVMLPGMAHVLEALDYNQDAFPNLQAPNPVWVAKGLALYDPRQDTAYGGTGTQTLANRASYTWSQNPYIAALNWVLGIWVNGVRVMGLGAPIAMIDVPAFINGANYADEQGWTCGGCASSADDRYAVFTSLLQAGSGLPATRGGQISCFVNQPLTSLYTITEADVVGSCQIQNMASWRDSKNRILPTYREENYFWQQIAGQLVAPADFIAEDGGEFKTIQQTYSYVQNATQAQQIATLDLCNTRESLTFDIVGKPYLAGFDVGQAVTLNIPFIGANNQLCVITGREIDLTTWQVTLHLRSETTSKHAFSLGQSGTAPARPALSVPLNEAPGENAWAITAETTTASDGSTVPALVINGASDDPYAQNVIFEYSTDAVNWTVWTKGPAATTTQAVITGLTYGQDYYAAVSYESVRNVVGDRLVLGPAMAGATTASYVATVPVIYESQNSVTFSNSSLYIPNALATINGFLDAQNVANSGTPLNQVLFEINQAATYSNQQIANAQAQIANVQALQANTTGQIANTNQQIANTNVYIANVAAQASANVANVRTQIANANAYAASLQAQALANVANVQSYAANTQAQVTSLSTQLANVQVLAANASANTTQIYATSNTIATQAANAALANLNNAIAVLQQNAVNQQQNITTLTSNAAGVNATVQQISTAMTSNFVAISGTFTSVNAAVAGANTLISQVQVAQAANNLTVAGQINTLSANLANANAQAQQIVTAQAANNNVFTGEFNSLNSTLGSAYALANSTSLALATTNSSLVQTTSNLQAGLNAANGQISAVSTALANDNAVLTQTTVNLQAGLNAANGSISTVSSALATANSVLTQQTTNLQAGLNAANGVIVNNNQAFVSANAALTNSVTSLTSLVSGAYAQANTTATALATTNSTLVQTTANLQTGLNAANGAISAVSSALANDNAVLTQTTVNLQAGLNSANSSITAVNTALATANSALVSTTSGLQAGLNAANTNIVNNNQAFVNANAALTNSVTTLTSRLNSAYAEANSTATAFASANSSLVQTTTNLQAGLNAANTAISTVSTALANDNAALTQTTVNLQAGLNSANGAISTVSTALATANSVLTQTTSNLQAGLNSANGSISAVNTAFVAANSVLTSQVQGLTSTLGAAYAEANSTATAFATANSVLTQTTSNLQAGLNAANGQITALNTAMVTANSAQAQQINGLTATLGAAYAEANSTATAFASANSVLTQTTSNLQAGLNAANGSISAVNTAFVAANSVLTQQVQGLTSTVGAAFGEANSTASAFATANSVLTTTTQGLQAGLNAANGSISAVNTAFVAANSVLTQSVNNVSARVNSAYAEANSTATAFASANSVLTQTTSNLQAGLNGANSAISGVSTALATANSTLTQSVQSLGSNLNNVTANVTTMQGTISTLQGKTTAYWQVVANTGSNAGIVSVYADNYGSDVYLGAGDIYFGPNAGFNTSTNTLQWLHGGYLRIDGAGFGANSDQLLWTGQSSYTASTATSKNSVFSIDVGGNVWLNGNVASPWATLQTPYTPAQTLAPNPNLLAGGDFSTGSTNFSKQGTNTLHTATGGPNGLAWYGYITGNAVFFNDSVQVVAGQTYSFSGWCNAAAMQSGYVRIIWQMLNSSGTVLSTNNFAVCSAGTGWTQYTQANVTAPSGTVKLRMIFDTANTSGTENQATYNGGGNCGWAGVKVEQGSVVTPMQGAGSTTTGAVYTSGATMDSLQPAQAAADVTSLNQAMSLLNQGSLATLNSLAYGSSQLTGFGSVAGQNSLALGGSYLTGFGSIAGQSSLAYGGSYLTGFGTLAPLSSISSLTAGGITGQAPWATYTGLTPGNVANQVQYLTTSGQLGAYYVINQSENLNTYWPATTAADKTGNAQAASFQGQGTLATANQVTWNSANGGISGFPAWASQTNGSSLDSAAVIFGGKGLLSAWWPQGQNADNTSQNTAAGFAGQQPWATFATMGTNVLTTNQSNICYNSTWALSLDGWTGTDAFNQNGIGFGNGRDGSGAYGVIGGTTSTANYYGLIGSTTFLTVGGGGAVYFACELGLSGGSTNDYALVQVAYCDPSSGNIITYGPEHTTTAGPWQKISWNETAPTSNVPSAGYWAAKPCFKLRKNSTSSTAIDAYCRNIWFSAYGQYPWNDYATYGAMYPNGTAMASLQPAQYAADVTSQHQAASIPNQGYLATQNTVNWNNGGNGAISNMPQCFWDTVTRPGYSNFPVLRADYVVQGGNSSGAGSALVNFWPAQASADVTSQHQASSVANQGPYATAQYSFPAALANANFGSYYYGTSQVGTIDCAGITYGSNGNGGFTAVGLMSMTDGTGRILQGSGYVPNVQISSSFIWSADTTLSATSSSISVSGATVYMINGYSIGFGSSTMSSLSAGTFYSVFYNYTNGTFYPVSSGTAGYFGSPNVWLYCGGITCPTSGSSSGGGNGGVGTKPVCVLADSYMPDGGRAADVQVGDLITVLTEDRQGYEHHPVAATGLVTVPCVMLTTASGASVGVSIYTPVTQPNGGTIHALDALGYQAPVLDADGFRWERIVSVDDLGDREVARIGVNDRVYAAGAQPGRYVFTHNLSAQP